jgi:hypothetical protein
MGHRMQDSLNKWVKAAALKYGTHLRTPGGTTATVTSGHNAWAKTGWMWDLTVTTDHDFYIQAAATAILVHNCNLSTIADEVHAALGNDQRALDNRTVGILETSNGSRFAANAGDSFTQAQREVLSRNGIQPIPFRAGVHAEGQLLDFVNASQDTLFPLAPKALGASREFCSEICQPRIVEESGSIADDIKNAFWEPAAG